MKRWRKEFGFIVFYVMYFFEEVVSLGDRVGVMFNGWFV